MDKIKFTVENAELIEDRMNSSFSILKLDFFASGKNRHDTYVSEETLKKTASTIYNCPLVWAYDPYLDDIYTHTPNEVPCGFVPTGVPIEYKKLEDGRTMLSVIAYVWKRYSGRFLEFFERDGDKPVSVEISNVDTSDRNDGLLELIDFIYEAITVLGTYVTPAIPDANASVVRFSTTEKEEYEKVYRKEFSSKYDEIDFTIPEKIKKNAKKGLALYKEHARGGTSVSLSIARYFVRNEKITPEKARTVVKYFQRHKKADIESDPPNDNYISWMLLGGNDSWKWASPIVDQMNQIDEKRMSYFSDTKEMSEMEEDKKVEEFEKTEEAPTEEKPEEKPEEEKKFEAEETETPEEEKKETPEEEKKEGEFSEEEKPEDEKKEETPDDQEKQQMSLDEYLDVNATLAMLENETESAKELACEVGKGAEANFGLIIAGLFALVQSKNAEVAELREFKATVQRDQMTFEIETTLKEVEETLSKDQMDVCRADATKYSFENIHIWKNAVMAKAFEFSKGKKPDGINRIPLPLGDVGMKKNGSLWG